MRKLEIALRLAINLFEYKSRVYKFKSNELKDILRCWHGNGLNENE